MQVTESRRVTPTQPAPRVITIAILAMGGEGGGVLADWLVDLAEHNGWFAQTTSVPGVAQRTGATIYYIELFPEALTPPGKLPVMAMMPVPGEVDLVLASELMESGRAIQRGLVTPDRTTLITSTHRVYSMTERTAMGDGRVDDSKLVALGREHARRYVGADYASLAEQTGSLVSAVMFGAAARVDVLPFTRAQFEESIRRSGVGVASSLRAFEAGFGSAASPPPPALDANVAASATTAADHGKGDRAAGDLNAGELVAGELAAGDPTLKVGERLRALARTVRDNFPSAAHSVLIEGIKRLADYQDVAYAQQYVERLQRFQGEAVSTDAAQSELLHETARHLALWMSYEDTVRVADLKTRRTRFERVGEEVRLESAQMLDINEFLHPRIEEIADTLPAPIGRWLLASGWARGLLGRFTKHGRIVKTTSIRGFVLLYFVASLRGMRRRSLRFGIEHARIDQWLATIETVRSRDLALALEVARCQRLVKGYGDTHARGWSNFQKVLGALPALQAHKDAAPRLRGLREAALADEDGAALQALLAGIGR